MGTISVGYSSGTIKCEDCGSKMEEHYICECSLNVVEEMRKTITRLRKALDGFIDYADNFYDHDVDSGYHHVQKLKKKALKEK